MRRVLPLEGQVAQQELAQDRADGPHVDGARVLGGAQEELGRTVVARANVRDVGLPLDEHLGAARVDQLEAEPGRVDDEFVRLEIAVADAHRVDVLERADGLIHVGAHVVDGEAHPWGEGREG